MEPRLVDHGRERVGGAVQAKPILDLLNAISITVSGFRGELLGVDGGQGEPEGQDSGSSEYAPNEL